MSFPGHELDRITGKLTQSSIFGQDTGRFLGNSSKYSYTEGHLNHFKAPIPQSKNLKSGKSFGEIP